jgi:hypothetical protein
MTSPPADTSVAAYIWGDLFEVAVKRGCLGFLATSGYLPPDAVEDWKRTRVEQLHNYLYVNLDLIDPAERARHSSTLAHMLVQGYGLGWTALREAFRQFGSERIRVRGLHGPLQLPGIREQGRRAIDRTKAAADLWTALSLGGQPDGGWADQGGPANADLLLWLQIDDGQQHVLALEFSANPPAVAEDFSSSRPHLWELLAHTRRIESRGVFTRIGATLTDEQFTLSKGLVGNLSAFTTRDKPLFKLCQSASYATEFVTLMAARGTPLVNVTAHAIAITNSGVESLRASAANPDNPRWKLMLALGEAYREHEKLDPDNPTALNDEIRLVRTQIVQGLPPPFRRAVAEALEATDPASGFQLQLSEHLTGLMNPATPGDVDELLAGVDESAAVCDLLSARHPREHVRQRVRSADGSITLRHVHAAAIRAATEAAPPGRITVIAAEGCPGIGKTTAVMDALRDLDSGFLWLYASPRLVINGEVTNRMARVDGKPTGILTLTANARLISGASAWWRFKHPNQRRRVEAAVVVDGVPAIRDLKRSTILVTPDQGTEIEARFSGTPMRKRTEDEYTDRLSREFLPGVLETLARTTRDVLDHNRNINRLLLATSIQGFRNLLQGDARRRARDTVERLSELFGTRASEPGGDLERARFAQRIPTIVVMVDEIAGDGAGGPFVHALARWLNQEFIDPFTGTDAGPYRVIFVLSDASLANADVFGTYLEHELDAPEKVLVSPSQPAQALRVHAGTVRLSGLRLPVLHVMADGYFARSLQIDYQLQLVRVKRDSSLEAQSASARKAVLDQESQRTLRRAVESVFAAVAKTPRGQQVIFYAQDKLLLRAVCGGLLQPDRLESELLGPIQTQGVILAEDQIAILDAGVPPDDRIKLVQPSVRDTKRLFLMTSSGARGVSFPLATTIIAMVPRFAIESGFMELAQLIYRGRGDTRAPWSDETIKGDLLDRRIVLILQDFLLTDDEIDARQWLRRTIDMLSALVLLRATLLTRMTGDSGIPGQRAAIVPVGRIGTDEAGDGLANAVGVFLHECDVFLYRNPDVAQGLVRKAREGVATFFESFERIGRLESGQQSITEERALRPLVEQITARVGPLLDPTDVAALPEQVYCLGPVWLESWTPIPSEESFQIRALSQPERLSLELLRRQLRQIGGTWRTFPLELTWAARDLARILERPEELGDRNFRAKRRSEMVKRWACVPLEYTSFCFAEGEHGRLARAPELDEHAFWRDGMLRLLTASATPATWEPIIPRYKHVPFLVVTTSGDPTGLSRAFDGRYFMASTELNLLNTLLFVPESEASSNDF